MAFFARPNLDDTQFKQLEGSLLTLSGQTQIATTTGLTLIGDGGANIPIQATGGSNNYVLAYDDTNPAAPVIKLKDLSGGTGSGVYPYNESATTTVGGLLAGQNLYNEQVVDILQDILVPTLAPTTYDEFANSLFLSAATSATIYEIGCSLSVNMTSCFYRGCVDPTYCGSSSYVAGLPTTHVFVPDWGCYVSASTTNLSASYLTTRLIADGFIPFCSAVAYSSGVTPTYNSDGSVYCAATPADITPYTNKSLCGIYPWFYGSTSTAPILTGATAATGSTGATCAQCLITGGTDCVGLSTSNIVVDNYCVIGKYIWFAIPSGATNTKTVWDGGNSLSNCGTIPGDLFQAECVQYVYSPYNCWGTITSPNPGTPIPYKFYVSNYPTSIDYTMTYKNS